MSNREVRRLTAMVDHDGGPSIPQSALPTPLVGYERRGDEAVVTTTNAAFESAFGPIEGATSLAEWLTARGVEAPTAGEVASMLADGEPVDRQLRLESSDDATPTRYRLRSLDPEAGASADAADRYCLLTEQQPASSVELDRLASVISHDLRNPLDVANAHLRAARETGDEDHFETVAAAHDRMERIIRDVLTLTRGEGALDRTADVDIGAVAADAWATVDTGDAELAVDDLPTTAADPDRLTRLFENLFRNSVEHGSTSSRPQADDAVEHGGDGDVAVRVGPVDGGFFVADDGAGIPADDRERVFEPGYTTDSTSAGTGLGLTIVAEIADAHEWTVSLTESTEGGARFEFRPAVDGDRTSAGGETLRGDR